MGVGGWMVCAGTHRSDPNADYIPANAVYPLDHYVNTLNIHTWVHVANSIPSEPVVLQKLT